MLFQSTRPHGGATDDVVIEIILSVISIHAPAWGRDPRRLARRIDGLDFNPRARMGARRVLSSSPFGI
mgnify:CR=1 FL=1